MDSPIGVWGGRLGDRWRNTPSLDRVNEWIGLDQRRALSFRSVVAIAHEGGNNYEMSAARRFLFDAGGRSWPIRAVSALRVSIEVSFSKRYARGGGRPRPLPLAENSGRRAR